MTPACAQVAEWTDDSIVQGTDYEKQNLLCVGRARSRHGHIRQRGHPPITA